MLDPQNVPKTLVTLLPMAEKWGMGDDCERDLAIKNASVDELENLIHCIDSITDDDLFGWLSGEESYSPHPTQEYLAITCLTMAIDSAKVRLKRLK